MKYKIPLIQYWSIVLAFTGLFLTCVSVVISTRSCIRLHNQSLHSSIEKAGEESRDELMASRLEILYSQLKYWQTIEDVDKILGSRKGWTVSEDDSEKDFNYQTWENQFDIRNPFIIMTLTFIDKKLIIFSYTKGDIQKINLRGRETRIDHKEKERRTKVTEY